MGSKRLKFQKRKKYVPKEKQLGKFIEEENKPKNPEDVKKILELWEKAKKEKQENKDAE